MQKYEDINKRNLWKMNMRLIITNEYIAHTCDDLVVEGTHRPHSISQKNKLMFLHIVSFVRTWGVLLLQLNI